MATTLRDAVPVVASYRRGVRGQNIARGAPPERCRKAISRLRQPIARLLQESDFAATFQSRSEFAEEARFLLAAKLYELGRLSSGQAAKLCGKTRVEFLLALPRVGVKVSNLSADDADDEISFARNA